MISKVKIIIGTLIFLFSINSNAQAPKENRDKTKKQNVEEVFKKRDKNEDGKLEKSELVGIISNDFERVDTDEDGFLTLEEFKKAPRFNRQNRGRRGRPNIDEMMTKMDSNQDGKLSEEEAKGPLAKRFAKIDTNEDGYLTKDELEKAPKPNRRRGQGRQQQGRQN